MSTEIEVEAVILAGGQGTRMGGTDKGLQTFRGAPLALHALMRIQPQVDHVMINANRNIGVYEGFGIPVVCDKLTGFFGPLAGMHAALQECTAPLLLTLPCDVPHFPKDLRSKLSAPFETDPDLEIAIASVGGRAQPVFMMLKNHLLMSMETFLRRGDRKIDLWYSQHKHTIVEFDDPQAFHNVNTLDELQELEKQS